MKRTELDRKKPLQRKTPLARKKPVNLMDQMIKAIENPKPLRKKKPAVAAAQYAQKRALNIRSGGRCEMEVPGVIGGWERCRKFGKDPAHVYTRPKCGGARDLVDAVIHACRGCHDASEGKLGTNTARVPLRAAQRAWDAILAHSKLGVDEADRLRIHIGSVGPRPEKGVGPYA